MRGAPLLPMRASMYARFALYAARTGAQIAVRRSQAQWMVRVK